MKEVNELDTKWLRSSVVLSRFNEKNYNLQSHIFNFQICLIGFVNRKFFGINKYCFS